MKQFTLFDPHLEAYYTEEGALWAALNDYHYVGCTRAFSFWDILEPRDHIVNVVRKALGDGN